MKVAIIGLGQVGMKRRFFINKNNLFKLVAASDIRFKSKFSTRGKINYYKNYNDLINNENLDAAFVTLPNYLASKVTIACLKKNLHVFCEKPPARSLLEIKKVKKIKLNKKGLVFANIPGVNDAKGGVVTIARQINQDKTSNFANADSLRRSKQLNRRTRKPGKVVYETITIPLPVYIEVGYTLTLYADYQQQINEMISPFITRPGNVNAVSLKKDDHVYEAFIQSGFSHKNNLASLSSEERKYETAIIIFPHFSGFLFKKEACQPPT